MLVLLVFWAELAYVCPPRQEHAGSVAGAVAPLPARFKGGLMTRGLAQRVRRGARPTAYGPSIAGALGRLLPVRSHLGFRLGDELVTGGSQDSADPTLGSKLSN
jgi:hypothetical protein